LGDRVNTMVERGKHQNGKKKDTNKGGLREKKRCMKREFQKDQASLVQKKNT